MSVKTPTDPVGVFSFGTPLDGVFAAPDDTAPRRVYADWLQTKGDPRGELIAVQCDIHELLHADPAALLKREQRLLREYKAGWTLGLRGIELRRGFVEAVLLRLESGTRYRALLAREPVRRLEIRGGKISQGKIRTLLPLFTPVLQTLELAPERPQAADGLGEWIASGSLRSLETLKLSVLPADAVEAIIDPACLPSLAKLDLAPGLHVSKETRKKLDARFGAALR